MKTNTKKARKNVKAYIMQYARYDAKKPNFTETAQTIFDEFRRACWSCANDYRYYKTEQTAFEHWASGLPSSLNCCYFYNRSAVDDLGAILEQTETEKARYTESESEKLLTYLIYREIKNAIE